MEMKCTYCGNEGFIKTTIVYGCIEGSAHTDDVEIWACRKCGHIEQFLTDKKLNDTIESEKRNIQYKKDCEEYEKQQKEIDKQIATLNDVINDENQTVKAIKEAKQTLNDLQNKKRMMRKPQNGRFPFGGF